MRQLGAMLKKNFLLKRRKLCVTCCELLTPVALMAVLVIGYTVALNDVEVTDAMVYANDTSTLQVRACDSHVRFTSTAKHHQVRTKIFSTRRVRTYVWIFPNWILVLTWWCFAVSVDTDTETWSTLHPLAVQLSCYQ